MTACSNNYDFKKENSRFVMIHHTRVLIDIGAFENNIRFFKSMISTECRLCAVIKADAYGHGLEWIAPAAVRSGADVLGIVDNWEAERIRSLGLKTPLVRLRPTTIEEAQVAAQWQVEECIGSMESAEFLSRLGEEAKSKIDVHLELDIGIGRVGFSLPFEPTSLQKIDQFPGIRVKGIMAHFPCADDEEADITLEQQKNFEDSIHSLATYLPHSIEMHIANSAACLRFPQSHKGMVRIGIAAYGLKPSDYVALPSEVQPVMTWKTIVAQIRDVPKGSTIGYGMTYKLDRDHRIATLPIGYADGYLRAFSNNSDVLIHGTRCPVVGRISMDMTTVDVSHLPDIRVGDEAILLGTQGEESISAEELAWSADTINYEICCLIGKCNRPQRLCRCR